MIAGAARRPYRGWVPAGRAGQAVEWQDQAMTADDAAAARAHAEQAAATAAKLKPGTWDAVQALALTSIAYSLASLADQRDTR